MSETKNKGKGPKRKIRIFADKKLVLLIVIIAITFAALGFTLPFIINDEPVTYDLPPELQDLENK